MLENCGVSSDFSHFQCEISIFVCPKGKTVHVRCIEPVGVFFPCKLCCEGLTVELDNRSMRGRVRSTAGHIVTVLSHELERNLNQNIGRSKFYAQ